MDALNYLFGLDQFGIKLGLHNIRALCAALGNPQTTFRSILVAGTNGKGSVSAMLEAALRTAGHRTARYTSPHLVAIEERFLIRGSAVKRTELRAAIDDVRRAIRRLHDARALATQPTFFEVATAAAFELFRRASVEIAVLEVGLGGRFDATNVVEPIAAAVTTIDLDHEQYLGTSIAEIAREKAGVIRPGIPVVTGETKPEALAVLTRRCTDAGARLVQAVEGVQAEAVLVEGRTLLALDTSRERYGQIALSLRGRHQVQNAIVAVRLLEEIDRLGVRVPTSAVREGLARLEWRGRLDLVAVEPGRHVLLDAAHNPAGADALAVYLREVYPSGLPIVLGVMRGKQVSGIVAALASCATRFVCTEATIARVLPTAVLAARARESASVPVEAYPVPWDAIERAFGAATTVCVTGSIFLAGEVLTALAEREATSVP